MRTLLLSALLSAFFPLACAEGVDPESRFPMNVPVPTTIGTVGDETTSDSSTSDSPTTGENEDMTTEAPIDPYGPCVTDEDCKIAGAKCFGPQVNMDQVMGSFCAPECKVTSDCLQPLVGKKDAQCLLGPSMTDPEQKKYCGDLCKLGVEGECHPPATCEKIWEDDTIPQGFCTTPDP